MESDIEVFYKKDNCRRKDCSSLWIILSIVAITLSFFVGVLVGALTGIIATIGVGGIIAIIILLSVLFLIAIINIIFCIKNLRKKYCC